MNEVEQTASIGTIIVTILGLLIKYRKFILALFLKIKKNNPAMPGLQKDDLDLLVNESFPARSFIHKLIYEQSKEFIIFTIVMTESILQEKDSLGDYFVSMSNFIRSRSPSEKKLTIDFRNTKSINSSSIAGVFKLLGDFKRLNGMELIFIFSQKRDNPIEGLYKAIESSSKSITNFHIESI